MTKLIFSGFLVLMSLTAHASNFGCPTQGCPPPGTGRFGCPTQGCNYQPGARGSSTNNQAIIYGSNGAGYLRIGDNTYSNLATHEVVRINSISGSVVRFSDGTFAYVSTASRSGENPSTVQPAPTAYVGIHETTQVQSIQDLDLFLAADVVGNIEQGQVFTVYKLQDGWLALKDSEGHILNGWARVEQFRIL